MGDRVSPVVEHVTPQQKIKRSNYVALFWRNSSMDKLLDVLPAGYGWELDGET